MTGGLFSTVDPRAFASGLAMLATAAALVGWQLKGDPNRCRNWLGFGALALELLAAALALAWAVSQGAGMLALFFGVGFIGLALSKASTAGALVSAWRAGNTPAVAVGLLTLAGVYAVVYLAGAFGGAGDTAEKTATAAAQSAPVTAIDAQLAAARERLASLSTYADSTKAHQEEQAAAREAKAAAARVADLQANLDTVSADAAKWMQPDCTPKKDGRGQPYTSRAAESCAQVQAAKAAIERAQGGAAAGGYAAGHSSYLGASQYVADLESKRAALLSTGGAAQAQAAGADDRLVSMLTGLDIEQAAGIKWLFFVLAFDLLSLGLRIFSELHGGHDETAAATRQYKALLSGGLDKATAAAMLAGHMPKQTTAQRFAEPEQEAQARPFGFAPPEPAPATAHQERQGAQNATGLLSWAERVRQRQGGLQADSKPAPAPSQCDTHSVATQSVTQCVTQSVGKPGLQVLACAHCGKEFKQRTVWQKFCNEPCRIAHHGFTPHKRKP